jgi:hypothetical protein
MTVKKKGATTKKATKKDEATQDENIFNEESHTEESVEDTTGSEEEDKEVVIEENDNTKEEPVMSVTAVEDMLKNQEERWSQKFNKLLSAVKLGKAKEDLQEGAEYIADLEDDWLDNPAVFFAFSFNFSIHGDKNRGLSTAPPQGAIHFKPIVRTKRKGRKGEEVISVSSVKVHSKSVANYLRRHSKFGISFFENMDEVFNMNTGWAQKLVEANSSIQNLSDQQIIARCRQEQIPIGSDVPLMRKALVEKVAERAIQRQDDAMYGKLKKAVIDKKTDREVIERKITQ